MALEMESVRNDGMTVYPWNKGFETGWLMREMDWSRAFAINVTMERLKRVRAHVPRIGPSLYTPWSYICLSPVTRFHQSCNP